MKTLWLWLLHIIATSWGQDSVYWEHFGNDLGGTKYSPMADINKGNVGNLREEWTYNWGSNPNGPEFETLYRHQGVPLMVEDGSVLGLNLLIFCLPWRRLVAIDANFGTEVWFNDDAVTDRTGSCRGVATWVDSEKPAEDLCKRVIYMTTLDLRLMAVDAATGIRCPDFGEDGFLNMSVPEADCGVLDLLCYWFYNPPVVVGDTLAIGAGTRDNLKRTTPKGQIPGYHARTGQEMWRFWIIPNDPNDPAMATWPNGTDGIGSGNAWAPLSGDSELGLFFIPTSEATGEHQGIHRPGDNYYTTGTLALNATTGERVWFRQHVHHDIWNYDTNSQPVIGEITKGGEKKKVLVQGTKMGFIYVLDAATGAPVYEIEERAVKQSKVPGELTSSTQPFPKDSFLQLAPTSLDMTEGNDLWGYTDADKQFCETEMLKNVTLQGNIFEPSDTESGVLWIPGDNGGQHLTGVSLDTDRSILVVPSNHYPGISQLMPVGTSESDVPAWCNLETPDGLPYWECLAVNILDSNKRPCYKPTWVRLTAVDLNTGALMWERPLGNLPPLPESYGSRWYQGAVLLTGGGLVFAGNTEDFYFRAFDIDTGNLLWQSPTPMPAHACGTPITYRSFGVQYIAIMSGGCEITGASERIRGDSLIVFALP